MIDPSIEFQRIVGFGVTADWWAQIVGSWQANNRETVVKLLFDLEQGIGLSAYRYHIGAGGGGEIIDPWKKSESFEILPGIYDWNRDMEAVRILRMIHDRGVENISAIAFSPPTRLTRSSAVSGAVDGGSNLLPGKETEFARYLAEITAHFEKDLGISINILSPAYEPSINWNLSFGQEGCHYNPEELYGLVEGLQEELSANNLTAQISIPEHESWNIPVGYLDGVTTPSSQSNQISAITVHSYNSTPEQKAFTAGYILDHFPGMGIWMSEWSEKDPGRDTGMVSALNLAEKIYEDISYGMVNSWQYGLAVSKYETLEGLIYTSPHSQEIVETKKLWAYGNFSRFIRPGYLHIATQVDHHELLTTAYKSSHEDEIILVAINPTESNVIAAINLKGYNWLRNSVFETSATRNLVKIYQGTCASSYNFPPQSVSTLIISP